MDDTLHRVLKMESVRRGCPQHEIIQKAIQKHLVGGRELPRVEPQAIDGPRTRVRLPIAIAEPLSKLLKAGYEEPVRTVLTRLIEKYNLQDEATP